MRKMVDRITGRIGFHMPFIFDRDPKLHYLYVRDPRKRYKLTKIAKKAKSIVFRDGEWLVDTDFGFVRLRDAGSDVDVFWQILFQKEYQTVVDAAFHNGIEVKTVVDAGSNIGLTALYLAKNFTGASIYAIEPDPDNYEQLLINTSILGDRILPLKKALWSSNEKVFLRDDFRDGRDWARNVSTIVTANPVTGLSLNSMVTMYSIDTIDILKIDIEGGEAEIFKRNADVSFLKRTKLIAIEIHDEFECRESIVSLLRNHEFVLYCAGELTIGINRHFTTR